MSDFSPKNNVVQDNSLLSAMGSLDAITIKLFEIIVGSLNTSNPQPGNVLRLDKNDLFFMFQDVNRVHSRFAVYLRRLQKQIIEIKNGSRIVQVVPVPTIEYGTLQDDNEIRIVLNDEIMPYLINLKKNFTNFPISDLYAIRKKYSLILFQFAYNQFNIKRKNHFDTIYFDLTVAQLRELTGTQDVLTTFSNFEKRVLKDSCDEIAASYSSIRLGYKKIKVGREIKKIRFVVSNGDVEVDPIQREIMVKRHKEYLNRWK